jgi:hypothetical protein
VACRSAPRNRGRCKTDTRPAHAQLSANTPDAVRRVAREYFHSRTPRLKPALGADLLLAALGDVHLCKAVRSGAQERQRRRAGQEPGSSRGSRSDIRRANARCHSLRPANFIFLKKGRHRRAPAASVATTHLHTRRKLAGENESPHRLIIPRARLVQSVWTSTPVSARGRGRNNNNNNNNNKGKADPVGCVRCAYSSGDVSFINRDTSAQGNKHGETR